MNTEEFVDAVRIYVRDAAVADVLSVLRRPPGRRPDQRLLERSAWYNGLAAADARCVDEVVADAVDAAIFGLFAALDGSRTIVDGEHFELRHVGGTTTLLNDPAGIGLNEVYNANP